MRRRMHGIDVREVGEIAKPETLDGFAEGGGEGVDRSVLLPADLDEGLQRINCGSS